MFSFHFHGLMHAVKHILGLWKRVSHVSPQLGQASLRPPTRLSNSALTPSLNGEPCALAPATAGYVGWLAHPFATSPRAPLALVRRARC